MKLQFNSFKTVMPPNNTSFKARVPMKEVAQQLAQHAELLKMYQALDAQHLAILHAEIGLHKRRSAILGEEVNTLKEHIRKLECTLDLYRQRELMSSPPANDNSLQPFLA